MNTYDEKSNQSDNSEDTTFGTHTEDQNESPTEYQASKEEDSAQTEKKQQDNTWKRAGVAAGAGVLIGGVAAAIMSMTPDNTPTPAPDGSGTGDNHSSLSNLVDEHVSMAHNTNDSMSFGEAFAAARAEVGSGGCFEWHGQLYGTYTAEEWNSMSSAQRAEYGSHFKWNNIDSSSSDVAHHASTSHVAHTASTGSHDNKVEQPATDEPKKEDVAENDIDGDDDDIEIVSVNRTDHPTTGSAHTTPEAPENIDDYTRTDIPDNGAGEYQHDPSIHTEPVSEPEVEIIGVAQNDILGLSLDVLGVNVGAGLNIGSEPSFFVNIEKDQDIHAQYESGEQVIEGDHDIALNYEPSIDDINYTDYTVDDGSMMASNDDVDYSNEGFYEG